MSAEDAAHWPPQDARLADLLLEQLLHNHQRQSSQFSAFNQQKHTGRLFFGDPEQALAGSRGPADSQRKSKVISLVMQVRLI